ncbi:MAG: radical SAM protein [Magnetovibrio sp.]|nr:radical SAM protein [Magnetovibrio sp.]
MAQISHELKYYKHSMRILVNRLFGREVVALDKYPAVEVSGVCNLNCVFCAYKDKDAGKVVMSNDDFTNNINQLADLGHDHLVLTPQTGDVFIDKHFGDKIAVLERHPKIKSYEFITNLISASDAVLDRLAKAQKLTRMYISLYGHTQENFEKITGRSHSQYRRLIKNINYLAQIAPDFKGGLGGFVMTNRDLSWSPHKPASDDFDESDVLRAVRNLAECDQDFYWSGNHVDFDSWGGRITQSELDELDLGFRVVGPSVPMIGPCGMLFGGAVILADGQVNACGCRAVGTGLIIGDSKTTPLREILSPDNPKFKALLARHTKGDYPEDCIGCKIFTSIYRRPHGRDVTTVEGFIAGQRKRCERTAS